MSEQRIEDLEREAEALRAEVERLESAAYGADEWTAADEAKIEGMSARAWALADEAAQLRASALLQNAAFAAIVAATLETMPPGPTNPGDPGVWHAGREYWAYEVVELAERLAIPLSATAA